MKLVIIILSSVLIFLQGCKDEVLDMPIEKYVVNGDASSEIYFSQITKSVEYISLNIPKDIDIANITNIKAYDNVIFIHDRDGTMTITGFDKEGNYLNQLNRIGKGPGEYTDIEIFAYDQNKKQIVIYNRDSKSFNYYSFPELEFIKNVGSGKYVTNFEILENGKWLVICDDESGDHNYQGIELWDDNFVSHQVGLDVSRDPISVEMSFPNTLTMNDGNIHYANPHEITIVYSLPQDQLLPFLKIDFGQNKIPSQEWRTPYVEIFEKSLQSGKIKSFWVQNLIVKDSILSFWFYFGDFNNKYLVVCNRETGKVDVFSKLIFKGLNLSLPPAQTNMDDRYISVLYPDLIDTTGISKNNKLNQVYKKSLEHSTPILIMYSLF